MKQFWIWLFLLAVAFQNALSAPCPYRCMCFRTTVRCMFLHFDKVPEVPAETTILDLRFNKIRELPANTFKNLNHLNTLLLNNNHITNIEEDAFKGLKELRYLYLYKNRIRNVAQHAFRGLHKLEQLYIHFNKIEDIEAETFADLPALERLFLHNNKLSRIPKKAFQKLTSLRRLRLDSNALICDCEILWLADMLKSKQTQTAATCESPQALQGKSVMALNKDDFKCKKPKLTTEPHDVDVSFGGTVFFLCKAEGQPDPEIHWLHNNDDVSARDRYSVLNDGTLMIKDAQDVDQGVYECMARNEMGEIKSRPAKMHYFKNKMKPHLQSEPEDRTVIAGSTVVLPCSAVGHPKPTIEWRYNDAQLPTENERFDVSETGPLTIFNVDPRDKGSYSCTARNVVGKVSATGELSVLVPPTIVVFPEDKEVALGSLAEISCEVEGFPQPTITWRKDGRPLQTSERVSLHGGGAVLRIKQIHTSDQGVYQCLVKNDLGETNHSATLTAANKVPPVLVTTPSDQSVKEGQEVVLPCMAEGVPTPQIFWQKDGRKLEESSSHYRLTLDRHLVMQDVKRRDAGKYECVAENEIGYASSAMHLTILGDDPYPGDNLITAALVEAEREVDSAINATLKRLFTESNRGSQGAHRLFQAFRFPSEEARKIARGAEVYERTIELIKTHVSSENHVNSSSYTFSNLLSPTQLNVLANKSGCLQHRDIPTCSDSCFHNKFRTIDGTCNNLRNPLWGASLTAFNRHLDPIYEDGLYSPVGWSTSHLYHGHPKPAARLVSSSVISTEHVTPDAEYSHMIMQWGQFLDHDLDFSMPAVSHATFADGSDCASSCVTTPPCYPIVIPSGDRRAADGQKCIELVRSSAVCGSGVTSPFFDRISPREQVNQLTSFLDASNVYGSTKTVASHLRNATHRAFMRTGLTTRSGKGLLPFADHLPMDCQQDRNAGHIPCFFAGDVRANEQLGLLTVHTVWVRQHNHLVSRLSELNPHWTPDRTYHEARKIVGAQMQHITFAHWLPKVLGTKGREKLGEYAAYNPNVNPGVANAFATAAFRFGHTLINPVLTRLNETFQPIREGHLPLDKAFFAPHRVVEEGGIDPLLRGLFYTPAKLKVSDQLLNHHLTDRLFTLARNVALDLAAINIQRGRDHALPGYADWRAFCNLSRPETFDDLKDVIGSQSLRDQLKNLYGHPGNIDLFVGGVSEDLEEGGARMGPLFRCIIVDQFRRIRDGDRFWYEKPGVFSSEQLSEIKRGTSFARVLCANGDNITRVSRDVFRAPAPSDIVDCDAIDDIDLRPWTECCQDCSTGESFNSITRLQYRNRRSATEESLEAEIYILKRSVKQLQYKVNALESKSWPPACLDLQRGVLRRIGERWSLNCTICSCQDTGEVYCKAETSCNQMK